MPYKCSPQSLWSMLTCFLKYWFNTPLTLSIWPLVCGWTIHIKRQFCSHLLEQLLLEDCCKLGISIIYNELKHPMVPNSHFKEQLCWIESYCNHFCWSHICQLGESINYHQNGVHSIWGVRSWNPWRQFPTIHLGLMEAYIICTSFYKWTLCFDTSHKCAWNVWRPLSSQANTIFSL
jgi:hypothetical protein